MKPEDSTKNVYLVFYPVMKCGQLLCHSQPSWDQLSENYTDVYSWL